jgi:3-oxoadipate enol-lactonase
LLTCKLSSTGKEAPVIARDTDPAVAPARFADSGAVRLYYESQGRGAAVLLVMGMGISLVQWRRTAAVLARDFRVLSFDNRGVGSSDSSLWPYPVAQMADDAIAVLDAAGEEHAHVYGISLGGMVAQELALRHPERLRALVLGATTPGSTLAVPSEESALSYFPRSAALTSEEAAWASVPYLYAESTRRRHGQRIATDIARRSGAATGPLAQLHQLTAAATHDAGRRLEQITAPTLVLHGAEDRLVPPANARILAETIPGAELRIYTRAGHLYPTDEPRAEHDVARFLLRHSPELKGIAGLAARARHGLAGLVPAPLGAAREGR